MIGLFLGARLLGSGVSIPQEFIGLNQVASQLTIATGERHVISPELKNEVVFIAGFKTSPDTIRSRIASAYSATWTHHGATWTFARTSDQQSQLIKNFGEELRQQIGNRLDSWFQNGSQSLPFEKLLRLDIGDSILLSNDSYPFAERADLTTTVSAEKLAVCVHRNIDPRWQFTLFKVMSGGKLKQRETFKIRSEFDRIPEGVDSEVTGNVDESLLTKLKTERNWSKTELLEIYFGDIFRKLASKYSGLVAVIPDVAMIRGRFLLLSHELPFPIQKWFGQISGEVKWTFDSTGTLYCTPSEPLLSERGRADRAQLLRGLQLIRRQGLIGTNRSAYESLFALHNAMYREAISFAIHDAERFGFYGTGLAEANWQFVLFSLSQTERRLAQGKFGVPIGSLSKTAQTAIQSLDRSVFSPWGSSMLTSRGKKLEDLRLYLEPIPERTVGATTLIHMSDKPNDIRILETHLLGTWLAYDRAGKTSSSYYKVPLNEVKLQPIRNRLGRLSITKDVGAPSGRVLLSQSIGDNVDSINQLPISDQKIIQKTSAFVYKILSPGQQAK